MRIELFYKTKSDLLSHISFITSSKCVNVNGETGIIKKLKVNLPNKVIREPLGEYVRSIRNYKTDDLSISSLAIRECDICVHYSLKNNAQKDMTFKEFQTFMEDMNTLRVEEVLLVSGSSKGSIKRNKNTVTCLEYISKNCRPLVDHDKPHVVNIAVAYNCYFPDSSEQQLEFNRLEQKLATGLVKKVYLQFGTDVYALRRTLESFKNDLRLQEKGVEVVGSIFVPSKQLLARFKFRPWNGVYLSESYLSDLSEAINISKDILKVYKEYGVEMVVESSVKTAVEVDKMYDLIEVTPEGGLPPMETKDEESLSASVGNKRMKL